MKEIKAIVQPFVVERVLQALAEMADLPGLTVSQVLGWGRSRAQDAPDRVEESGHGFSRKSKLELVVPDELVHTVVDAIAAAARTGRAGDGKIFVYEVTDAIRIRTDERGEAAL